MKNIVIASTPLGNTEPGMVPLPQLGAIANAPVDQIFFEAKAFPNNSLDNYGDLKPTWFSHPYLYALSWGHIVIPVFCNLNIQYLWLEPSSLHYDAVDMIDYPNTGMRTSVLGQM